MNIMSFVERDQSLKKESYEYFLFKNKVQVDKIIKKFKFFKFDFS